MNNPFKKWKLFARFETNGLGRFFIISGFSGLVFYSLGSIWGTYIGRPAIVVGESMRPTIHPSDIVYTVDPRFKSYKRGDVAVFGNPMKADEQVIKRIVAIEGDIIQPRQIFKDPIRVPKGYVWIEGDNGKKSRDSTEYGPVPIGLMNGIVVSIVWPLSRFRKPLDYPIPIERIENLNEPKKEEK